MIAGIHISQEIFVIDMLILKNTKIRILYPKKHDERTYHFTMEVTPWGEKSVLFAITSQSLTLSLFDIFHNKTRT